MGKLSFTKNKFIFDDSNGLYVATAKKAGFRFDDSTLRWTTINIEKAAKLRKFADNSAEQKFKKYFFTYYKLPEQIIYPDHLEPKLFQFESVRHILTRSPVYCADDAGTGKTITSALCMNTVPGKVLIVCPPSLKYNWEKELSEWLVERNYNHEGVWVWGSEVIDDATPYNADVVIIPDSLISKPHVQEQLTRLKPFKWLFIDEAHRYIHEDTQRTEALLGPITDLAERVVFLSGTPFERPIELEPIIMGVAPETMGHMDTHTYRAHFCAPKEVKRTEWIAGQKKSITNWDYNGASNLTDFKQCLFDTFMIRHEKRDVLPELPPKTRSIIFLDQPKKILKYEKAVLKNHTMEELLNLSDEELSSMGDVSRYRKECGLAIIKPATEFLKDLLESLPKPLVVFAQHIDVVEGLTNNLKKFNPLMMRGGTNPKAKQRIVELFQQNKKHRLIVLNIESGGVGHTLTRAERTVHVEYDWKYTKNEQCEDRINRIGQRSGNSYHQYLALRNSLHERMLIRLLAKESVIKKVMSNTNKGRTKNGN